MGLLSILLIVGLMGRHQSALWRAIDAADPVKVQQLIDKGYDLADLDMYRNPVLIAAFDYGGRRDIIYEAVSPQPIDSTEVREAKALEVIRVLVANGADVDACGNGATALGRAVNREYSRIVAFLLEHGADPNRLCPENTGPTLLELAQEREHREIVELLIKHGATQ